MLVLEFFVGQAANRLYHIYTTCCLCAITGVIFLQRKSTFTVCFIFQLTD